MGILLESIKNIKTIMELTVLPVAVVLRNILNLFGLSCLQHFIYQEWGEKFLICMSHNENITFESTLGHNENITMLNYSADIFLKVGKWREFICFWILNEALVAAA